MARISSRVQRRQFRAIPEINMIRQVGGLESGSLGEKLDLLADALNYQANQLDEWREAIVQLLLRPLLDEGSAANMGEDAYEKSIQEQDDCKCPSSIEIESHLLTAAVYAYMEVLQAAVSDRHDAITGQTNNHIAHSTSRVLSIAQEGEGQSSPLIIDLLESRSSVKPKEELGSMRGITSELWSLRNSLRHQATETQNIRVQAELALVVAQHGAAQTTITVQLLMIHDLERFVDC